MANKRTGAFGSYYGSYYSESVYLTQSEMEANAKYICLFFLSKGWTKNAIAGILGNMQQESTLNPGCWQSHKIGNTSGGYGLVQWTPASNYINWCGSKDPSEIDNNLARIIYELENGLQYYKTDSYPETFREFTQSTKSIEYLVTAFLKNYERAGAEELSKRISYGEKWYSFIANIEAETDYTPRTDSNGIEGDFHYYSKNPFYTAGYGLPNCTCYAYGRFWEIADPEDKAINKPTLSLGNAGQWYGHTSDGYERGKTPKLGAVICWNNPGEAGHVAIVEEILSNGDIVTSNSAWNSTFFYMKTYSKAAGYNFSTYEFQGFIYNPFVSTGGGTTPDPDPDPPDEPDPPGEPDWSWVTGRKKGFNWVLFNQQKRRMRNAIHKRRF